MWPLLDAQRLTETFPGWLAAMTRLVERYRLQATDTAGASYQLVRAAAGVQGSAAIVKAGAPSPEWLAKALGYAGPGVLTRSDSRAALTTTLGTADRLVQDAARATTDRTMRRDKAALGYYRMTRPRCCYFCAMLSSRGVVYKEGSFARSDPRFTGTGTIKVHNACSCLPVPVFSRGDELPGTVTRFRAMWDEHAVGSGDDAVRSFRRAYEGRAAA